MVGLYLINNWFEPFVPIRTANYPAEQVHGGARIEREEKREPGPCGRSAEVFEVFQYVGLKGTYQWGGRLIVLSTLVNIFAPLAMGVADRTFPGEKG
jgi:hypothetical protein